MCTCNIALEVLKAILDHRICGAHRIVIRCKLGSVLSIFPGLCGQSFSQNTLELQDHLRPIDQGGMLSTFDTTKLGAKFGENAIMLKSVLDTHCVTRSRPCLLFS